MLEFKWQKAVGQNNILDFLTRIKGGMFRYNLKKTASFHKYRHHNKGNVVRVKMN